METLKKAWLGWCLTAQCNLCPTQITNYSCKCSCHDKEKK